jgi:hypothetical protein
MPTLPFDFLSILKVLVDHRVDFVVVGGISALVQGVPLMTFDLDIVHSRAADNLERLLAALEEMEAIYRHQGGRRIKPGLSHLASAGHQLLETRLGPLDLLGTLASNRDYDNLRPHTVEVVIQLGLQVPVLDLPTLIAVKEETGRDKDKAALPILRQTLEEKQKRTVYVKDS